MVNFVGYRVFKGKSKRTGRDYNFIACCFVDDSPRDTYINGYETFTGNVDGSYDTTLLNSMLGSAVNIVYNRNGSIVSIDPIKS